MLTAPRPLREEEIEQLLSRDVVAALATIDAAGFPHVTPLWFLWSEGAFWMTSLPDRPHLSRLAGNLRAGICVETELPEREDGERPNRQVRATGYARISLDENGDWTRRIRAKYLHGAGAAERISARSAATRRVIRLEPERLVALASV